MRSPHTLKGYGSSDSYGEVGVLLPHRQSSLPAVVIPSIGTDVTTSYSLCPWFPHTEGMVPPTLQLKVYIYFPHQTKKVLWLPTCPIHLEMYCFSNRNLPEVCRVRLHQVHYHCILCGHPSHVRLGNLDIFPFAFLFVYVPHYWGVIHNTAERAICSFPGGPCLWRAALQVPTVTGRI